MLAQHGAAAKLLAGGQSLVPILNFRLAAPQVLIDLNRIDGLADIELLADGTLTIGAMTREAAIEESALVRRANPLLAAVSPYIAHPQIRNRGTIGGSLAHADPAAELPAVCVASDALLDLLSARGRRTVAAGDFFRGVFATALAADEMIERIRFPAWPVGRRCGFREFARRHGDFALVGVAALVDLDDALRCRQAHLVAFGVGDRPERLAAADAQLAGAFLDAATIARAAGAAARGVTPRADHHASSEYRRELVEVMARRALMDASGAPAARAAA